MLTTMIDAAKIDATTIDAAKMDATTIDVADRLALHELAARYGNAIDDRDWLRLVTVFTADARYELAGFGRMDCVLVGSQAICEFMAASTAHPIAHHVTNIEVDATAAETRMFSKIVGTLPGGKAGSADYRDVVTRTADGWRIASRVVTNRRAWPA